MSAKEILVVVTNLLIAAGAFVLVGMGKVPWQPAALFVAVLLVPSAAPMLLGRLTDAVARRDPPPPPEGPSVLVLLLVLGALGLDSALTVACAPIPPQAPPPPCSQLDEQECAAQYGAELDACSITSKTLKESVACENTVRGRYGRPLRPMPATAPDGGAS